MASGLQRQIWVVDDSPLDLDRAVRALNAVYTVRAFSDGSSVLEALAGARTLPDVLVVDWVMESVSGLDVCQYLKSAGAPLSDVR